jgi:iron complex transport system ATP-binding protein
MLLEGKNIDFSYGPDGFCLSSISLSIEKGEVVSLIGPNGAGKTTLIKIFSGLTSGYTGELLLNSKKFGEYKGVELAKFISYIPQVDMMTFDFTVEQLVSMGRRPFTNETGLLSKADIEIVRDTIDSFGLYNKKDLVYNNLSGGEKRMVLIARAIAQEAGLLLMDEPMTYLDMGHQVALMEKIMELNGRGRTVFMISHGINLAAEYVKRVILMKNGRILDDGTPEKVISDDNIRKAYGLKNFYIEKNRLSGRPNVIIVPGKYRI